MGIKLRTYMDDITSDNFGLVLEHIESRLAAILEGQAAMVTVPTRLRIIDDRLANIETDMSAIKAVVTDHSRQLDNHEIRITDIEAAA